MHRDLNGVLWIEAYRSFPMWATLQLCGPYTDFKFEVSECRIDNLVLYEAVAPNIAFDGKTVTIYMTAEDTERFGGTYGWRLTAKKGSEEIFINSGKIKFI